MAVDDDESSEGEDLLADIVPTPSDSMESTTEDTQPDTPSNMTNSEIVEDTQLAPEPEETAHAASLPPQTTSIHTTTQTSSTLRARTSGAQSPQPTAHTTARAALFANRRRPGTSGAGPETSTATAEAILDQQAAEREDLADKVFLMAKAMKQQQQSIADSLDSEKDVLSRATEGMERAGRGMEAAKGRMGALQRMTEGKGWWGRIMLYAWVYGLMVALVLLVFVMPKLRF
jgi:hypothetical protein